MSNDLISATALESPDSPNDTLDYCYSALSNRTTFESPSASNCIITVGNITEQNSSSRLWKMRMRADDGDKWSEHAWNVTELIPPPKLKDEANDDLLPPIPFDRGTHCKTSLIPYKRLVNVGAKFQIY